MSAHKMESKIIRRGSRDACYEHVCASWLTAKCRNTCRKHSTFRRLNLTQKTKRKKSVVETLAMKHRNTCAHTYIIEMFLVPSIVVQGKALNKVAAGYGSGNGPLAWN